MPPNSRRKRWTRREWTPGSNLGIRPREMSQPTSGNRGAEGPLFSLVRELWPEVGFGCVEKPQTRDPNQLDAHVIAFSPSLSSNTEYVTLASPTVAQVDFGALNPRIIRGMVGEGVPGNSGLRHAVPKGKPPGGRWGKFPTCPLRGRLKTCPTPGILLLEKMDYAIHPVRKSVAGQPVHDLKASAELFVSHLSLPLLMNQPLYGGSHCVHARASWITWASCTPVSLWFRPP